MGCAPSFLRYCDAEEEPVPDNEIQVFRQPIAQSPLVDSTAEDIVTACETSVTTGIEPEETSSLTDCENEPIEPFPLLDLPDDLIWMILQYLSPAERLRARVNWRIFRIESSGKYYSPELVIGKDLQYRLDEEYKDLRVQFDSKWRGGRTLAKVLKKWAKTIFVESLEVTYTTREEIRKYLPLINAIQSEMLWVTAYHNLESDETMESHLNEWLSTREILRLSGYYEQMTGDDLFFIFNMMTRAEYPLRSFQLTQVQSIPAEHLLHLMGIRISRSFDAPRRFHTKRRDVEIFSSEFRYFFLIGSTMSIVMDTTTFSGSRCDPIVIERHRNDRGMITLICEINEKMWSRQISIRDIRKGKDDIVKLPLIYE